MDYTLNLSLEHASLVKIVVELWTKPEPEIKTKIEIVVESLGYRTEHETWDEIVESIEKKTYKLSLPEPLKKKVLDLVKPVGLQLLKWFESHITFFHSSKYLPIDFISEAYWTQQGTIDKKKTAKLLIDRKKLSITGSYDLACIYCLEDDIKTLWEQFSGEEYFKKDLKRIKRSQYTNQLSVFWSHYINGEIEDLNDIIKQDDQEDTPFVYAFWQAAGTGNLEATKYFLEKLTSEEKERLLTHVASVVADHRVSSVSGFSNSFPKEYYTEVLCFLLSQMNEEQQMAMFKDCPYDILECLLDWPWQNFFMPTVEQMWDFLPGKDVYNLLSQIVDKAIDCSGDYNYHELFREFWERLWQKSNDSNRKHIINACIGRSLLSTLFELEDINNIKLILGKADPETRKKAISYIRGVEICKSLMNKGKWELLEMFITECLHSESEIIRFKAKFEKYLKDHCLKKEIVEKKDMFDKCFQLLDDLAKNASTAEQNMKVDTNNCSPGENLSDLEALNLGDTEKTNNTSLFDK